MSLGVWGTMILLNSWLTGAVISQLAAIFLIISSGGILYYITLYALTMPELTLIEDKLLQRVRTD